jgi:hypothetical protein
MRPLTIYLDESDIEELRKQAVELILPPHTYARSLLVTALRVRAKEACDGPGL